ncbi:MAG: hisA/hisF family protein [Planctomycetia bacterium]|nr:hisA/hisF family protein [Planctomycetia bacterium]
MQIIPVLDLKGGLVVRGVAGRRDEYRPVVSRIAQDARPATVARAFAALGLTEAYVADLDAIAGAAPALHIYRDLMDAGLSLWVDAGCGDALRAQGLAEFVHSGKTLARIVVGLESLASPAALGEIAAAVDPERIVFSLDLKDGTPICGPGWNPVSPVQIARFAFDAGIREIIVLDLADVGAGGGVRTLDLCRAIRGAASVPLQLVAGGGVRGLDDLRALSAAGCDAALVASALHDGRLTRKEIDRARTL